jgi:hypothetical protein
MDIRGDLGGPGGEAQDTSIMQYAETIHILEILSENLPVRRSCWELGPPCHVFENLPKRLPRVSCVNRDLPSRLSLIKICFYCIPNETKLNIQIILKYEEKTHAAGLPQSPIRSTEHGTAQALKPAKASSYVKSYLLGRPGRSWRTSWRTAAGEFAVGEAVCI